MDLDQLMTEKAAPNTCYIVVSHGHFVDTIGHIYEGNDSLEKLAGTSYQFPDYCSISGKKDGEVIFKRSGEHAK
jgi:hypothetical protein